MVSAALGSEWRKCCEPMSKEYNVLHTFYMYIGIYVYYVCQSDSSQICLKGSQDLGFMMDLSGHLGDLSPGECLFRA